MRGWPWAMLGTLRDEPKDDDLLVDASNQGTYIQVIGGPEGAATLPGIDDLLGWHCDPNSSRAVSVRHSKPRRVWMAPPLEHTDGAAQYQGERLQFARQFEGPLERRIAIRRLRRRSRSYSTACRLLALSSQSENHASPVLPAELESMTTFQTPSYRGWGSYWDAARAAAGAAAVSDPFLSGLG